MPQDVEYIEDQPPMLGNPPGWPRQRVPADAEEWIGHYPGYKPKAGLKLPVPWFLLETDSGDIAWLDPRPYSLVAHTNRLCQVCGLALGEVVLLGSVGKLGQRLTNGPGCHPRCMALSLKWCPHFTNQADELVAYLYRGPGLGYVTSRDPSETYTAELGVDPSAEPQSKAQVLSLARLDPLGDGTSG